MDRISRFTLGLILCLVLALPGIAPGARAAPPPPADLPPRRPGALLEEIPHLQLALSARASDTGMAPTEVFAWSKLAFESWRNSNWDIYTADGDGSNQTRRTSDGAMDCCAQLNRGCSRIVFASRRTGNYDIYAMDFDGSGVTRLTSASGNDVNPAWSADGTRIAFHSYRDGQAEVYVMNADGSGLTRLTFDGAFDGQPTWSPDGTRIAFVSTRTGGNGIWVMNRDGSGQTLLAGQAYSESPAWSPDGSQIAYDADYNGDGWQELVVMNADGSNQHVVYDPPEAEVDPWHASWSPDGRWIAFTRIQWLYYAGEWYWVTAHLDAWDSVSGGVLRLSQQGADWHPDWQSFDASPPASSVQSLPGQSPAPVTVRWSGADSGPAGLLSYDVQVRDGAGGSWVTWQSATAATSGSYAGLGGHTYYFRIRARDRAYNVEPWPSSPDAWTTVEAVPPRSAVQPLPGYGPNGLTVRWGGYDEGGSGVRNYDVQARDTAGGGWTDWLTRTKAISASFSGLPGHTYHFRSRARDRAQNLESWPPGDGDAHTTLYAWAISGVAHDNTGTPLAGVVAGTTPASFAAVASDLNGRYHSYVAASSSAYTATWAADGYGGLPATAFQGPPPPPPGPLLLMHLDEPAGATTFDDVSGNNHHGTCSGDTCPLAGIQGRFGTALRLDGVDDYVGLGSPVPTALRLQDELSLEAWIYVSGYPGPDTLGTIVGCQYDGQTSGYAIHLDGRTGPDGQPSPPGHIHFQIGDGGWHTTNANAQVPLNQWVHIVAVRSAYDDARIYYNGAQQPSTSVPWSGSISYEGAEFDLGRQADFGDRYFQGVIDEVAVYDRALSAEEVTALYAAGMAVHGLPVLSSTGAVSAEGPVELADTYADGSPVAGTADGHLDVFMPPEDNVVQNWGFESGGLDHWLAAGETTPVVTDTVKHSGSYATLLGRVPTLTVPVAVSHLSDASSLQLAVGRGDVVHMVWSDKADSNADSDVYYATRSSAGVWSSPLDISDNASYSALPQIATDGQGTVHMVWSDEQIVYARRSSSGVWSGPESVSDGQTRGEPQVAHGGGLVHVVWTELIAMTDQSDIFYAVRDANGTWSEPHNISSNAGESWFPRLAVDPDGGAHVTWRDSTAGPTEIFYAHRSSGGAWSEPRNISSTPYVEPAELTVDSTGVAHVVWSQAEGPVFYARRSSDGTWSDPEAIGPGQSPRLAVDARGRVHVVWAHAFSYYADVFYAWRSESGTWSVPENLSESPDTGTGNPHVAVDNQGVVHAVWEDGDTVRYSSRTADGTWLSARSLADRFGVGGVVIAARNGVHLGWRDGTDENPFGEYAWYAGTLPSAQLGDSTLAQLVSVPAAVHKPTLSFVHLPQGGWAPGMGSFTVEISQDASATTVLSQTAGATDVWSHRWVDLTPWAGQPVMISFTLHQAEDAPVAYVYLDEVSVGSTYPDLWVRERAPAGGVMPGETFALAIVYGNRGGAVASDALITAALPAELSFVSASPAPIATAPALVWDVGDLVAKRGPYHLVVTTTLVATATMWSSYTSTAQIGSSSLELQLANNQGRAGVFVGRRLYLPLAQRGR